MCDSDKIMAEVSGAQYHRRYPLTYVIRQFVSARVYELRAQMNAGKVGESEKAPMLQRLLQYR